MAGVSLIPGPGGVLTMNDPLFKNWLKAVYGLEYLKSGLKGFVSTQVGQRYSALKQQVFLQCPQCKTLNLTGCQHVQPCYACISLYLLPDHGAKGCTRGGCFCTKRPKTRRKCPNNFCSVFYDLIVKDHTYSTPRWSSTYIPDWCQDSIQYAKCFLGSDSLAQTFDEIDCTGILSIVIHNLHIHNSINDVNLFTKCRKHRNAIFHKGIYEVTDQEVNDYIDDMIKALEDGNILINDPTAKACVTSLNTLRNDQITITNEDIVKLVQDSRVAINDLSDKVKQEIDKHTKQAVGKIDEHTNDGVRLLSAQRDKDITKIDEQANGGVRLLSEQRDQDISTIDGHTNDALRLLRSQRDKDISQINENTKKGVRLLSEHTNDGVRELRAKRDEAISNIEQASTSARIRDKEISISEFLRRRIWYLRRVAVPKKNTLIPKTHLKPTY